MQLTIGRRIGVLVFTLLVILGVSGGMSYRSLSGVVDTTRMRKQSFETTHQLDAVLAELVNAETGQRGFIITGTESYLQPYKQAVPALDGILLSLRTLTGADPEMQRQLDRVEPLVSARLTELADTIAVRRERGFEAAQATLLTDQGKTTMDAIRQLLTEMSDHEERLLDERSGRADASIALAQTTPIIVSVVALVVGILASYVVARSITRPLSELLAGTVLIGAGDLDHRIEVRGRDETADLGQAFNGMALRLKAVGARLQAQAAQREKVLLAVTETAQQLAAASQELLAGATQQAAGMQEQAAAVAETVTVVDEVAHTATQAADRAKFVATSARRSEEVALAGKRAVDDTVGAINLAKGQADSVAGNIASLAGQTQAIGEIVALITDIAEQTNLLALNAAIEASRAGEHGRGFSVVATEVKSLAEESKQATRRVRQILGDIQKMANTAVLSTEEGARGMTTATRQADTAGQTIDSLGGVIAEVAEAASQIAASAGQQATGLTQIHQAMRDIKHVSSQNLAATHQAQRAASDLAALGTSLKALLAASPQADG
ncbi:MAG: CHASE3 domain-containing protein [Pseudomonadota bacterium]|nr:CHASE3 domain-containing protein [Pseudomonadota bacterium]